MVAAKGFTLTFLRREKVLGDVFAYYFSFDHKFSYASGQYIQMTLPHLGQDARGSLRFFTVSSSPTEKNFLMITTQRGVSSFKKNLFGLKVGTKVQFFGPMGKFILPV